jgi:hypothetical protein
MNNHQKEYICYLSKLSPLERCHCGWNEINKCQNRGCVKEKTYLDRIIEQNPNVPLVKILAEHIRILTEENQRKERDIERWSKRIKVLDNRLANIIKIAEGTIKEI